MNEKFQKLGLPGGYPAAQGCGHDQVGRGGLRPVHLPSRSIGRRWRRLWGTRLPPPADPAGGQAERPGCGRPYRGHQRRYEPPYLAEGVFQTLPGSLFYIERTQSDGKVRHGLIGMVDLDQYDFTPGSGALIRATEGRCSPASHPGYGYGRTPPLSRPRDAADRRPGPHGY